MFILGNNLSYTKYVHVKVNIICVCVCVDYCTNHAAVVYYPTTGTLQQCFTNITLQKVDILAFQKKSKLLNYFRGLLIINCNLLL